MQAIVASHVSYSEIMYSYPESVARALLNAALMPPLWVQEIFNALGGVKHGRHGRR